MAEPLDKVTLAPLKGAVNVTVTPLMGLPDESVTVACNGEAKVVPTTADWNDPPAEVIRDGLRGGGVVEQLVTEVSAYVWSTITPDGPITLTIKIGSWALESEGSVAGKLPFGK
jgi:hypothetical protein